MPPGKITAGELPDSGSANLKKRLFEQKIQESAVTRTSTKVDIQTSGQTRIFKENFEIKASSNQDCHSAPKIEIDEAELAGRAKSHASRFEQIAAEQQAVSPATRRKLEGVSVDTRSLGKLFEDAAKKEQEIVISGQKNVDDEVDFAGKFDTSWHLVQVSSVYRRIPSRNS